MAPHMHVTGVLNHGTSDWPMLEAISSDETTIMGNEHESAAQGFTNEDRKSLYTLEANFKVLDKSVEQLTKDVASLKGLVLKMVGGGVVIVFIIQIGVQLLHH